MKRFICSAFFAAGLALAVGSASGAVMLDKIVAVVNNESITWSELYREMEFELSRKADSVDQEKKMEMFRENEAAFLEDMINKKLQLQEARSKGISVSSEDVAKAVSTIREKYGMTEGQFNDAVQAEGFTPQQYSRLLREQITIGRLVEREVREKVSVSEEDVKKYIESRNGGSGTQYRISQIFVRNPEGGGSAAAREKIDKAYERLSAGVPFKDVAAEYSEDASAKAGGDLGYVDKDSLSREFLEVIQGMSTGSVSRPFSTAKGMHIIKLDEVRDVRALMQDEAFNRQYRQWLKGLRERSFIDIRL